jgi:hypothetical protein
VLGRRADDARLLCLPEWRRHEPRHSRAAVPHVAESADGDARERVDQDHLPSGRHVRRRGVDRDEQLRRQRQHGHRPRGERRRRDLVVLPAGRLRHRHHRRRLDEHDDRLACGFAASGASNLTFIGLQLQRFQYSAIYANASPNLSVKDNTIHDLSVAVYNVGGIALHASSGASVENNYIHDVAYLGIGAWGAGMSNTTVSGNVVLSSCGATAQPGGNDMDGGDCGAIYLWDGVTHASTNIAVTNNYVRDVNVSSNGAGDYTGCCATGLYLDDGMSNVTVSGNVVTGTKSQCFVIHGGNDDTFKDNLCDLDDSTYERIMTYQWDALKLPMSGNVIEDNVIVSSAATGGTGYSDDGTPTAPTIKNNAYYNYAGTMVVSSGGNGSDANPTYENPGIACWDPSLPASSPVYAAPVSFVKLAGGWGPPGFVLPQTGTAPSWPHGC